MDLNFIFMLTRQDQTVTGAGEYLEKALGTGIRHIGFKDVGLPFEELKTLAQRIHQAGATCYLEVVSLDLESELRSARAAVELGVDYLLGGTHPEAVLPVIAGSGINYYPFAGRVVGHPSVLEGSVDEIVASAREIAALEGVDGLDLLAYRMRGDVDLLMDSVCRAVSKPVIMAGSIDSEPRIAAVAASGAAGFTVGTAALDGVFPTESVLDAQLEWILERSRQ
ncbi:type 1 periplasmic-binding domain-containing protein [Dongshaea marina]|uniref:4-hydroxythreonine-4-phosphate dehydrogenase n=1 Tax=Dongshaea marina TaxID=2047966 RepID=UPI000D3E1436|nr:4-hydroxythreonine-4-phosphate dehydrogenase [Dongshaea marina]